MYHNGWGVPQDYIKGVKWHRQAAEQGHARAQGALGAAYYSGEGLPQDYVLAHMWLNLSAAQSYTEASQLRDNLAESLLTPSQIAEAQRLAREWKPKTE